jgi:DNA invertase Pin-like site-specific DNA recombinase
MPQRFRKPAPEEGQPSGPFQPIQLPTSLNLIVYPRQSTQAQLLHHATSTEMQTDDLIEIGVRYGWPKEKCLVIDDDLGVSGTLGIDEREGLTKVMEQIDQLQSRAVLVVNEDRLFRDETMIQVNVFIKFMRDHNAYVLTPYMVYNFQERFHVKMFREKAEYAAAYITEYVRERLAGARRKKALRGLYDGRPVSPSYRVDYYKKRPDGSDNPTYQKFVI